MIKQRRRLNFVVSSPSGCGKSTLVKAMLATFPDLRHSVSFTTRTPRPGEVDGREYNFISRQQFEQKIAAGHFAEWAEVHYQFYGTDSLSLKAHHQQGFDVILDVDIQGALKLQQNLPDATLIFILPPSRQELELRLEQRGSESSAERRLRLTNAAHEMKFLEHYDYLIVNDRLDDAVQDLSAVIRAERLRRSAFPADDINRVLAEVNSWS